MKKTASLTTAQKAMALLLSLLLVFSLLAPLGGLFNVAAASEGNDKFYDDRDYYVNLAVLATGSSSVTPTDYMAQFVNNQNNVQWQSTSLSKALNYNNNDDANDILIIPSVGDGTDLNSAVRLIVRDTSVTNPSQNQTARAESDIRVIFQADSVQAMETTDNVTFTNPAITALNARGAAVNIGNTVSATGTKMEKYKDSGKENVYYIDIDKSAFENSGAMAFRFSADGGRYTTAPLEILEHGGYVLYQGAIPTHPRIYEISASQLAENIVDEKGENEQGKVELAQVRNTGAKYQNYFVLSDDERFIPSKYSFPYIFTNGETNGSNSPFLRRNIFVYNADWADCDEIYATGDLDDPVREMLTLVPDKDLGKGWFVANRITSSLVVGATYIFHPNKEDPTLDASEPTTIPLKSADGTVIPSVKTRNEFIAVTQSFLTPAYDEGAYSDSAYPFDFNPKTTTPDTVYYMSRSVVDQWLKKSDTHLDYDYLVPTVTNHTSEKLYCVDATYYDYLSDNEIVRGVSNWTMPNYDETSVANYNQHAADMFSLLNDRIQLLALSDKYWRYPLYFGNFWPNNENLDDANPITNPAITLKTYYNNLISQLGNDRYTTWEKFFAANNSNGLGSDDSRYVRSVMGLVYPELKKTFYGAANSEYSNELLVGNAGQTLAPYFDANWLIGDQTEAEQKRIRTQYKEVNGTGFFFVAIPNLYNGVQVSQSSSFSGDYLPLSKSIGKVLYTNHANDWYSQDEPKEANAPSFVGFDGKNYDVCGMDGNYYYLVINNKWDDQQNNGNWDRLYLHFRTVTTKANGDYIYQTVSIDKTTQEYSDKIDSNYLYNSDYYNYTNRRAYVVKSQFPFRMVDKNGITHFQFNSGTTDPFTDVTTTDSGDIVKFYYTGSAPRKATKLDYWYNSSSESVHNMDFSQANNGYAQWGGDTGFFPFHNEHTTTAHNFGFGTKIETKFKLPASIIEGQLKGGTFANGETAKFTFAGDDDVWVFVDGQLVLDLGGAHKQAKGEIDFGAGTNKIKGASNDVAYAMNDVLDLDNPQGVTRLYEFVIDPAVIKKDESGAPFDDTTPFVFFDNSSSAGKILSDSCTYSNIQNGYYKLPSGDIQGQQHQNNPIHDNISGDYATTITGDGKYHIYAIGVEKDDLGLLDCAMRIETTGETILPQVKVISDSSLNYNPYDDYPAGTAGPSRSEQSITANINNTDPSMVHTMTIYYLERGMGESNLYIDFTTIPANTDVQVQKDVATENLNPGLVSGMEEVAKKEEVDRDTFAFHVAPYQENVSDAFLTDNTYQNAPFSRTDDFTHKTDGSTVGADAAGLSDVLAANTDNAFLLQDQQTADFGTYFAIGDKLTIGEAGGEELKDIQSRYRYETYFRLINGGTIVDPASDTTTFLQAGGASNTGNIKQAEQGYYQFNNSDGSVNTSVSFSVDYDNPGSPDLSQTVSRVLQYYNKVKTTDLLVSAEVLDGESYETDKDTGNYKSRVFAFKLECFIGGKWHALPLNATVFAYDKDGDPIANTSWDTHLSDDGMFILSQHNKILIHGLPINLPYRVTEIRSNQFKTLGYFINNDYNTVTGSGATGTDEQRKTSVENYLVPLTESGGNYATNSSSDEAMAAAQFSYMPDMQGNSSATLPDLTTHYLCSTYQGQDGVFVLNPCYDGSGAEAEQVANPEEALSAYNGKTTSAEALPNTVKRANSIQFVHTYEPAPGVLEVQKTVNGEPAEGPEFDGRFQFNAELIDAYVKDGSSGSYKDLSTAEELEPYTNLNFVPAVNDSDSIARFTGVSYSTEGYYLYALSETSGSDDKYTYSTEKYYAVVQVTASEQPGQFDTNVTYYDSGTPEPQVSDSYNKDANKWPCCGEQYAGEVFQGEKHIPIFHNATGVQHTDVTFTKLEAATESPLAGAAFTLYTDEECIQEGQKGAAGAPGVASSEESSQFTNPMTSTTDTQNNVTFADLDFTDGGNTKPKQGDTVAVDVVLTDIPADQTLGSVSGELTYRLENQPAQLQLDSRFAVGDSPDAAVYNGATVSIDSVEPDSGTLKYTVTFSDSGLTQDQIGDDLIIARFTFTALSNIDTQASKAVVVDQAVQSATSFGTVEPGESLNVTGYGKSYVPTAYYFKETEAPAGYSPLTGTFRVLIYSDGKYTIQYCADPTAPDKKWEDTVDDILVKDASGAVSVMNSASAKPPFVGGTGTCLLRFAGWLALAVCAAGCVMMAFGAAVRAKKRKG